MIFNVLVEFIQCAFSNPDSYYWMLHHNYKMFFCHISNILLCLCHNRENFTVLDLIWVCRLWIMDNKQYCKYLKMVKLWLCTIPGFLWSDFLIAIAGLLCWNFIKKCWCSWPPIFGVLYLLYFIEEPSLKRIRLLCLYLLLFWMF